jgi:hypothetical protein
MKIIELGNCTTSFWSGTIVILQSIILSPLLLLEPDTYIDDLLHLLALHFLEAVRFYSLQVKKGDVRQDFLPDTDYRLTRE